MKKSVRFAALALSAAMLLGLTACGGGDKNDSPAQEAPSTEESSEASDAGADNETAAPSDAVVLKLGTTVNEQDSFQVAAEKFKELVEERTNGAYVIEIDPNGTLGGERDMLENGLLPGSPARRRQPHCSKPLSPAHCKPPPLP